MKWKKEKENLEDMILNQKLSYEEIGRKYGCSGSNIKKVARKLEINLPQRRKINPKEKFDQSARKKQRKDCICLNCGKHFLEKESSFNKYCSNKCQFEYQHKLGYKKIIDGDPSIMNAAYTPRTYKIDIIEEQGGKCAICGCEQQHNGKPLIFILDHIDGHAANNKRENLRCICPNCDSQLDTYKSKNKSSDREYYHFNHR